MTITTTTNRRGEGKRGSLKSRKEWRKKKVHGEETKGEDQALIANKFTNTLKLFINKAGRATTTQNVSL